MQKGTRALLAVAVVVLATVSLFTFAACKCNHEWSEWTVLTAATCETDGVKTRKCSKCDVEESVKIDALGHEEVIDKAVAATCTETGLTEGKHCSRCDKVLVKQEVVKVLGHEFTDYKYNNDATCLQDGTKTAKCNRCEQTDTVIAENSALGHEYGEWTALIQATCETDGVKTRKCNRCDKTEIDKIEALGHEEAIDKAVAATCTETGLTEGKHCSRCDKVLVKQEVVKALGHEFTEYNYNNDATCLQDGTKTAKCNRCDQTDTITAKNTALGHEEVIDKAVAATCTETGLTEGKHCSRCNIILIVQKIEVALGHIFYDGVCSRCNELSTTVEYRCEYYFENANGSYEKDDAETKVKIGTTYAQVNIEIINREHYSLNESQSVLSGNIVGDGSLVLKAYYNLERVTVTFIANGVKIDEKEVRYGAKVTETDKVVPDKKPTEDKTFSFRCWALSECGIIPFDWNKSITEDLILYATYGEIYKNGCIISGTVAVEGDFAGKDQLDNVIARFISNTGVIVRAAYDKETKKFSASVPAGSWKLFVTNGYVCSETTVQSVVNKDATVDVNLNSLASVGAIGITNGGSTDNGDGTYSVKKVVGGTQENAMKNVTFVPNNEILEFGFTITELTQNGDSQGGLFPFIGMFVKSADGGMWRITWCNAGDQMAQMPLDDVARYSVTDTRNPWDPFGSASGWYTFAKPNYKLTVKIQLNGYNVKVFFKTGEETEWKNVAFDNGDTMNIYDFWNQETTNKSMFQNLKNRKEYLDTLYKPDQECQFGISIRRDAADNDVNPVKMSDIWYNITAKN